MTTLSWVITGTSIKKKWWVKLVLWSPNPLTDKKNISRCDSYCCPWLLIHTYTEREKVADLKVETDIIAYNVLVIMYIKPSEMMLLLLSATS